MLTFIHLRQEMICQRAYKIKLCKMGKAKKEKKKGCKEKFAGEFFKGVSCPKIFRYRFLEE